MDVNEKLFEAVKDGDVEGIKAALAGGACVSAVGIYGITPLHCAAWYDKAKTVPVLLAAGAEIDALDSHFNTPLHWAAARDNTETGAALLARGAKVNVLDERTTKMVKLFKRAGAQRSA